MELLQLVNFLTNRYGILWIFKADFNGVTVVLNMGL